jgi:hypothetical protein
VGIRRRRQLTIARNCGPVSNIGEDIDGSNVARVRMQRIDCETSFGFDKSFTPPGFPGGSFLIRPPTPARWRRSRACG